MIRKMTKAIVFLIKTMFTFEALANQFIMKSLLKSHFGMGVLL